ETGPCGPDRLIGKSYAGSSSLTSVASRPNDGGRSAGALPNCLLGLLPIVNSSTPPLASSAWPIQLLLHGLPFQVTDWMYGLPAPLLRVRTLRVRPSPTFTSACSSS